MLLNVESAIRDLRTVRDFIRWTVSRFNEAEIYFGHGTDDPWDEAVGLILYALHLPWDVDPRVMDTRLTQEEKEQVAYLIKQRVEKHTPSAYLTQSAWFAGLEFFVDERVLIPRSPIGELIGNGFEPWIKENQVHRVLDLCTGSGCIGIATAVAFPWAKVECVDVSSDALDVAQINVERIGVLDRVRLIESDLFENVSDRYDLIVTNPPYVGAEEMAQLPQEYHQEPELALASGVEGLDCVEVILAEARQYLTDQGILICEVGNSQQALEERYPNVPFLWLEFENGGHGVFMLTAQQLDQYKNEFSS
ncbi:MAG: 50S ribosomal protein L3 N(5)-glutamine methyltransferase [Pseudomonadales bacterium]|nr:50S ribosomal protein L3 N(5)-glutamine methyltransferase [Pseudomonadales bacterium]